MKKKKTVPKIIPKKAGVIPIRIVQLLPQLLGVGIELDGDGALLIAVPVHCRRRRWQVDAGMNLDLGLAARRRKVLLLVFALSLVTAGGNCRQSTTAGGISNARRRGVSRNGDLAGALRAGGHFEQLLGMLVILGTTAAVVAVRVSGQRAVAASC